MSVDLTLSHEKAKRLQGLLHEIWPELAEELRCKRFEDGMFEAVLALYDDENGYPPENPSLEATEEFRQAAIEAIKPFKPHFEGCARCNHTGVKVERSQDIPYWDRGLDEIKWDICDCIRPGPDWGQPEPARTTR